MNWCSFDTSTIILVVVAILFVFFVVGVMVNWMEM
jgi:hypothetical protein